MNEQDGAPDVVPGDGRVVGGDATGTSGHAAAPPDGTGPIERSQGSNRVFAGRYRLVARRGTATDVALFEAVDAADGRTVAVKIVHPDICARPGFGERFHETMQRVAAVRHPNLTEVIDVGTATWSGREVHYVVCENLAGGSLRDLRDRGRQLSPSQVVMIGLDACRGLDAAHRAGLVHGDVRPNTLVFGEDGRLRVADLGVASIVSDAWWDDPAGVNIDKAKYASPEQARGDRPVAKSDVYALDLCLLEAVTGQVPFVADSSVATLANRVDRLLPVSADLGPLAAVLERAGRPDADDRSSAAEFGRALHQAAERLPRPAPISLLGGAVAAAGTTDVSAAIPRPPEASAAIGAGDVAPDTTTSGVAGAPSVPAALSEPPVAPAPDTPAPDAPAPDDALSSNDAASSDDTASADAPTSATVESGGAAGAGAGAGATDTSDTADDTDTTDTTDDPDDTDNPDTDDTAAREAPTVPRPTLPPARPRAAAPVVSSAATDEAPATGPEPGADARPTAAMPTTPGAAPLGVRDVLRAPQTGRAPGDDDAAGDDASAAESGDAIARPRRRWPMVLALVVLLAAGAVAAALWFTRTISHDVPDLVGLEQGEALNMISEFEWDVVTSEEADDDVPDGVVVRTDPVAGTSLAEGSRLSLVISTGPAPRELPELAGLGVEEATAALDELGLSLEVGERPFDEDVALDVVIDWSVPDQPALVAGDTVLPGTTVVVRASAGPAPREVPDLTGLSVEQATTTLVEVGLEVTVLPEEFSDTVPAGGVARQDPPVGTQVSRGSTVSVAVSKGQDLVAVPPLAGLTVDQARAALEGAGLALGQVKGDPAGVNVLAEVGGQSIGGGAVFPRGTAIDLTFEVPAPPVTEPPPPA